MKRVSAVLLLALLAFGATQALAGHWVTKEIKWQITSQGQPFNPSAIFVRDTVYQALGGTSGGDTTAVFSLDNATVPPRGIVAPGVGELVGNINNPTAYQSDTTVVAWVLLVSDTTVVTTPTATSVTMFIDGKVGGFGTTTTVARGWTKADSALINGAAGGTMVTGDESYGIPIRTVSPYGNVLRWPMLRARISPATGTVPGCRVFVRYYTTHEKDE